MDADCNSLSPWRSQKNVDVFNSYGGGTCHDNTVLFWKFIFWIIKYINYKKIEEYFYAKHFNSHYATGLKETQNYNTELVTANSEQECARTSLEDESRNAFYFVTPDLCYLVNIRNEPMENTGLRVAWATYVLSTSTEYPCHPSNAINRWVRAQLN